MAYGTVTLDDPAGSAKSRLSPSTRSSTPEAAPIGRQPSPPSWSISSGVNVSDVVEGKKAGGPKAWVENRGRGVVGQGPLRYDPPVGHLQVRVRRHRLRFPTPSKWPIRSMW
jgi:hypothetical protein